MEYPFRMGLVREEEIERAVREGGMRRKGLLRKFMDESGGRVGVREKVEEVLERCCEIDEGGNVHWKRQQ